MKPVLARDKCDFLGSLVMTVGGMESVVVKDLARNICFGSILTDGRDVIEHTFSFFSKNCVLLWKSRFF